MGARSQTANFVVDTSDARLAQQIAAAAEKYRHDLAIAWLGEAMPNWSAPCQMTVTVGPQLGAGGATTFIFDQGEVFGWRMNIQGPVDRVFDSVLPHEITHMIFASHFRQPLPRWADEGGATSVEHPSERMKHRKMLIQFLQTGRGIAFNQMFAMRDYPPDFMPLYAQGYSLADYLIQLKGRRAYVAFLDDGLKTGDWAGAVHRHYGANNLAKLQNTWLAWVRQGSPEIKPADPNPGSGAATMLASNSAKQRPEAVPFRVPAPARLGEAATAATDVDGWTAGQPRSIYQLAAAGAVGGTASGAPLGTAAGGAIEVAITSPAGRSQRPTDAQPTGAPMSPVPGDPRVAAAVTLPSSGWRAAGAVAPGGAVIPASAIAPVASCPASCCPPSRPVVVGGPWSASPPVQVTRPQGVEQPRQTVIEWSRP